MSSEAEQWKISDTLKIDMNSEENASIFLNSFVPEMKTMPMKRSNIEIETKGTNIVFNVNALDLTAYRATINSILQFSNVVDVIVNYIEKL
jgi:tRNA threonylcarbamoyladenosine modification (KEOPS) complex  Pcc1 subunit